ncbi:BRO family protein [Thalassomonas sp. RHCl1]|uniref:BRO-N domain-containing protein n=1 Tax=Thalassomonas sp. RHCl1 TaxID=2995320 RepID=UPI00248ADA6C|nr:BRO family protein [Thalassomonas sp. RHCl1]
MDNDLINICYEGSSGESDIRTLYIENILYFSLTDVFVVLNKENKSMGESNPTRYIPNLIKSQIKDLDCDEYKQLPHPEPTPGYTHEIFVTQPGLNRVMGTDDSPAGRKFQRWLYHDVVPSLTKHGVYPPPLTPQGSALSQMAEIIAQNSRALADSIVRQDKLEKEVNSVKGEIYNVQERVGKLENNNRENEFILTVRKWFDKANLALPTSKELEIVNWCENLSLRRNKPRTACPSGERLNAKFFEEIILEAKSLVERARS